MRKILIVASARSVYRADDAVAQRLWAHALATALAADELVLATLREGTYRDMTRWATREA